MKKYNYLLEIFVEKYNGIIQALLLAVVVEFILTILKIFCQSELLMCYHIGISPLRWIG